MAGSFSEIGKDFEAVSKLIAREVASRDDNMTISPLVNTDRNREAYVIMQQQFKRAIGVAIVRGECGTQNGEAILCLRNGRGSKSN